MEIVVLEWILFFFPCLDKSFFNLIVTDEAGIHPEDEPYHTTTQTRKRPKADVQALQEYDYDEEPRMPTVVRRYNPPVPAQTRVKEETARLRTTPQRFFFTSTGVILLAFTLAIIIITYILPAYTRWNDNRIYGYPRTLHARANVGHGTREQPYSDFIAENVKGKIYVVEIGEGNTTLALVHAYYIIRLTGEGNDLISITQITFSDMNGDGRPDMLVTLENGSTFVLYNTGNSFSQQDPTRK